VFNGKIMSQQEHGFTLVELMVALLIFMVVMLGLAKVEISALLSHRDNVFRDEALRIAEDEVSRLKGESFSISGTSAALAQAAWSTPQAVTVKMRNGNVSFARSVQVTDIAATAIPMKRIDVAVGWTSGTSTALLNPTNRNHQTALSTIIVQGN